MYSVISINGTVFPQSDFSLQKTNLVSEYKGENGVKTIEVIREGLISGSISYKGLEAKEIEKLSKSLKTVSDVVIYDVTQNKKVTIKAQIKGVSVKKVYYDKGISVWSLSFAIEQI